jgi:DNA-binding MarR family transcriptional regulator
MKKYHLLFEKDLKKTLPKIVEEFSITGLYIIGDELPDLPYFKRWLIKLTKRIDETPFTLAEAIIDEVLKLSEEVRKNLSIAISGSNILETTAMVLVAQTFEIEAYLVDQEILPLFPFKLDRIKGDDLMILAYLYEVNEAESLGQIAHKLKFGDDKDKKAIARVSYSIKKLETREFVVTLKAKRAIHTKITLKGKQYIQTAGKVPIIKEED